MKKEIYCKPSVESRAIEEACVLALSGVNELHNGQGSGEAFEKEHRQTWGGLWDEESQ